MTPTLTAQRQMSYGALARNSTQYRELEVLSATPGQLVVLLFDHALVHLMRVRVLATDQDFEARSSALERARGAIAELLMGLDRERGGPLAAHLAAIYSFLLGELSMLGVRRDVKRLERVTRMVRELRDAFARAADEVATAVAG